MCLYAPSPSFSSELWLAPGFRFLWKSRRRDMEDKNESYLRIPLAVSLFLSQIRIVVFVCTPLYVANSLQTLPTQPQTQTDSLLSRDGLTKLMFSYCQTQDADTLRELEEDVNTMIEYGPHSTFFFSICCKVLFPSWLMAYGTVFLAGSSVIDQSYISQCRHNLSAHVSLEMFVPVALFISAVWLFVGGFV